MPEISRETQVGDGDGVVIGGREEGEVVGSVQVVEDMVVIEELEIATDPQASKQMWSGAFSTGTMWFARANQVGWTYSEQTRSAGPAWVPPVIGLGTRLSGPARVPTLVSPGNNVVCRSRPGWVDLLRVPKYHLILVGEPVHPRSHNAGDPERSLLLRAKGT
ncbi:hypothetical protein TIFTF001_036691 [Ficus carica]|uniref:Uncharacterized protein n=1 Tax=Ficus carica TaxID=3494 RepID=A0AA88E5T0_FICCA|nr:hypothetical protein TIFTF001_036691 [Ficus carica]